MLCELRPSRHTNHASVRGEDRIRGATRQYSSGNSRVVADRSASVIIHSFSPASVW
jgi:hypothetical protein